MKTTQQHTPEPWHTDNGKIYGENPEDCSDEILIADVAPDNVALTEYDQPNAQRIVACVNGCKGIENPETTVPDLVSEIEWILDLIEQGQCASIDDEFDGERLRKLLDKVKGIDPVAFHDLKVGSRVYWHDPEDELCSGPGTIVHLFEPVDDESIIALKMDDGAEVEAWPHELDVLSECVRCSSPLDKNGKCSDIACPFSDCGQDDPKGWIGHPEKMEGAAK